MSTDPRPGWMHAACLWEASAAKAGNVHPGAAFPDLDFTDFLRSADLLAEYYLALPEPWDSPGCVTRSLLEVARRVRDQVGKNTNLGILLLLAPLAAVPPTQTLRSGIGAVLESLSVEDTRRLYQAIRTLQPGGLGRVEQQDVDEEPTMPVRAVMALARDFDLIALQYANGFEDVLGFGLDRLDFWWRVAEGLGKLRIEQTVVGLHLDWMAEYPDSLIARKRGRALAEQAALRSRQVLDAGWPRTRESKLLFEQLDQWLREDGHSRNPGTSADLVAATLFAGLREGIIGRTEVLPGVSRHTGEDDE